MCLIQIHSTSQDNYLYVEFILFSASVDPIVCLFLGFFHLAYFAYAALII